MKFMLSTPEPENQEPNLPITGEDVQVKKTEQIVKVRLEITGVPNYESIIVKEIDRDEYWMEANPDWKGGKVVCIQGTGRGTWDSVIRIPISVIKTILAEYDEIPS